MQFLPHLLFSIVLFNTIIGCHPQSELQQLLKTYPVPSEEACNAKDGYWYNGKCWAHFNKINPHISEAMIDSVAEAQFKQINNCPITINDKAYPINFFMPEMSDDGFMFATSCQTDAGPKTLILLTPSLKAPYPKKVKGQGLFLNGSALEIMGENTSSDDIPKYLEAEGEMDIDISDFEEGIIRVNGTLKGSKSDSSIQISYATHEALGGAGDSKIDIQNNEAILNGTLGTVTYIQIKNLIKDHPNIKTLVLDQVPGSINDAINMHTGRLVREHGFTTKVLATSDIASGGVDLFCAGVKRIVHQGAKIGIHSWGAMSFTATDLPQDHPGHKAQIDYFTMCLGKKKGKAFYFRTLEAAPFDDIHYMSDSAIQTWTVSTKFIGK